MKVVAFVPIKLNNERLPNKNILPLGDKPLCRHLLDTLTEVEEIDEVYVFCSDESIIKYLPAKVKFLKREKELDAFTAKHYDIVQSFISRIEADVYVNAHVTNPFLKSDNIRRGLRSILNGEYDSVCAVSEIREHLWFKGKPYNFTFDNPPRTQDLEPLFAETGLFMYKKEVFINTRTRYGEKVFLLPIDKIEATDINYPEDYELAKAIYSLKNIEKR
jgi:CMP-N-acetylneuraminic acid synthetase